MSRFTKLLLFLESRGLVIPSSELLSSWRYVRGEGRAGARNPSSMCIVQFKVWANPFSDLRIPFLSSVNKAVHLGGSSKLISLLSSPDGRPFSALGLSSSLTEIPVVGQRVALSDATCLASSVQLQQGNALEWPDHSSLITGLGEPQHVAPFLT